MYLIKMLSNLLRYLKGTISCKRSEEVTILYERTRLFGYVYSKDMY